MVGFVAAGGTRKRRFDDSTVAITNLNRRNYRRSKVGQSIFRSLLLIAVYLLENAKASDDHSDKLFYKGDAKVESFIFDFFLPKDEFASEADSFPKDFMSVTPVATTTTSPQQTDSDDSKEAEYKPHFLFSDDNGFRVVEFYAQWCGHCQHYKPEFIQLAKDVTTNNPKIKFYAVSCANYNEICNVMDIHAYPTVMIFKENSVANVAPKKLSQINSETILKLAGHDLSKEEKNREEKDSVSERVDDSNGGESSTSHAEKPGKVWSSDEISKDDVFYDALKSFDYSLRTGVHTNTGSLSYERQEALTEWLTLLKASVPIQEWRIHTTVVKLLEKIDFVSEKQSNLKKVLNLHGQDRQSGWSSSCARGEPGAGYTCGLWQLMHIISVGIVEQNAHQDDAKDRISTLRAADTLRNFIANFFGCEECVDNFLSMYDSCELRNCEVLDDKNGPSLKEHWIKFPIWLWLAHNQVNVRLRKEELERKSQTLSPADAIAARWPPRQLCEDCWDVHNGYDENAVYTFLKDTYWPDSRSSSPMQGSFLTQATLSLQEYHHSRLFIICSILFFFLVIMCGICANEVRMMIYLCKKTATTYVRPLKKSPKRDEHVEMHALKESG